MGVTGADDNVARGNYEAKFEDVVGDYACLEAGSVSSYGDDACDR